MAVISGGYASPQRVYDSYEGTTLDQLDPNRSVAVNALIVYDLAKRAESHRDPYENLAEMYRVAEVSWERGDYKRFQKDRRL